MDYSQAYEPEFSEKDLVSIMNKVLNEFEDLFREKNIHVVRDFPQEPVRAPVDVDGIARVLRQVFKNSISMIGQTRGKVTASIQPLWHTGQVSIGISDNGHPIPDDIRNALLDSNLSTKTFGGGLGLPMVRKIIEAHNGHIELEVREGGNTVNLYLPIS
ncbi:MAG: hypothetical protein JRG69_05265 [Deltaproteobacteria bacterium]|nr:hypothetical protein [Deltaproteobacteria bacterium]